MTTIASVGIPAEQIIDRISRRVSQKMYLGDITKGIPWWILRFFSRADNVSSVAGVLQNTVQTFQLLFLLSLPILNSNKNQPPTHHLTFLTEKSCLNHIYPLQINSKHFLTIPDLHLDIFANPIWSLIVAKTTPAPHLSTLIPDCKFDFMFDLTLFLYHNICYDIEHMVCYPIKNSNLNPRANHSLWQTCFLFNGYIAQPLPSYTYQGKASSKIKFIYSLSWQL